MTCFAQRARGCKRALKELASCGARPRRMRASSRLTTRRAALAGGGRAPVQVVLRAMRVRNAAARDVPVTGGSSAREAHVTMTLSPGHGLTGALWGGGAHQSCRLGPLSRRSSLARAARPPARREPNVAGGRAHPGACGSRLSGGGVTVADQGAVGSTFIPYLLRAAAATTLPAPPPGHDRGNSCASSRALRLPPLASGPDTFVTGDRSSLGPAAHPILVPPPAPSPPPECRPSPGSIAPPASRLARAIRTRLVLALSTRTPREPAAPERGAVDRAPLAWHAAAWLSLGLAV